MEVKTNELRVGNWVNLYDDQNSQVTGLTKNGRIWCVKETVSEECAWDKVNAIQLTEEWLVKFGFERKERRQGWHLGYTTIWVGTNRKGKYFLYKKFGDTKRNITYVHQLQNLHYAMSNEELEFNE